VRVIVASVDSAEQSATSAEELGLANLEMASGLDAIAVAACIGGYLDTSDDPFLQPTAFVLDPESRDQCVQQRGVRAAVRRRSRESGEFVVLRCYQVQDPDNEEGTMR